MDLDNTKRISNKELIEKLKAYFITQDHDVVSHLLACMYVDMKRIMHQDKLPKNEKLSLVARMNLNEAALEGFVKNGPDGDIKMHKFNSDEWK